MRRTVSSFTTRGSPSGEPTPKPALLTKIEAVSPLSTVAMLPQGMSMSLLAIMLATLPLASSTIRQPGPLVRVVPSALGALPTITQPDLSMVIAVVRPIPPGQPARLRGSEAKVVSFLVVGLKATIVVPSPCRLPSLLKLVMRTSPFAMAPAETGATTIA